MATDLTNEIREVFAQASLQYEAARGLDGDGWAAYQKIQADHAAEARLQERKFLSEYQTRFEVARKRIIDEGGIREKKLTPRWFGRDKFDVSAIDRQADRDVLAAHQGLLAKLRQDKDERLDALLPPSKDRKRPENPLKWHFSQATNRRLGKERRQRPPR